MRGKNINANGATIKCTDVHVKKTDVRTGVRKEKNGTDDYWNWH